jgi:uncharacterized cupin superfamily protein
LPAPSKYVIRTRDLPPEEAVEIRHPLNPKAQIFIQRLADRVGMKRTPLHLARVPPGKESFVPHAHEIEEEYLFILEGEGIATIGEETVRVGPGDYLGFPTDGTAHHLVNPGPGDLVYLMGGERLAVDVAHFPTLGKAALYVGKDVTFYDEASAEHLPISAWYVKKPE